MKRNLNLGIVILLLFLNNFANSQSVDIKHFLLNPSINGISGFAYIPSAYVIPSNKLTLGLHRFEFKANYGLFDMIETGIYFDFSYSSDLIDILKAGKINLKLYLLDEEKFFISFAAGIEKCPLNVFEKKIDENFNLYFVVSKNIVDADITAGLKKNLTGLDPSITDVGFVVALSKVIYDTMLLILEYNCDSYNAGFKISMNSNITIDFFIKDIGGLSTANSFGNFLRSNFIFGIDYIQ